MTSSHSESEKAVIYEQKLYEEIDQLYLKMLGSYVLTKACQDKPFDYALKLRTGEVIRFEGAEIMQPGWIHLDVKPPGAQPDEDCLPFMADRGIDVRIEDIVWVMDAPEGS